jgi:hypothetical protein
MLGKSRNVTPTDYTLVWLKTDRHVSNGGKIRPLKIICGF